MRILYFTDGAGIDLPGIRTSLMRVPEVLSSLRKGQEQARYVDLFSVMNADEEDFRKIPSVLRTLLINFVQRGLHQRWVNRGHKADLILRRIHCADFGEVKWQIHEFLRAKSAGLKVNPENLNLLHFLRHVEITIIGPGFDEIEVWVRKDISTRSDIKVLIKDVIDSDPQLDWFWPQVKESFHHHA